MNRKLTILGTRGVPANHGGFETFAERLSLHLVARGWSVTVYCQHSGSGPVTVDTWNGVERVHIPVRSRGALGTVIFDLKATVNSAKRNGVFLVLGYNTAVFNITHKLLGKIIVINMDGIEWKRQKWGKLQKLWLWINERVATWVATRMIADNPGIADHLAAICDASKISMIPYGADELLSASDAVLDRLGLQTRRYATLIARPEPENSILEIVRAFSRCPRDWKLVVLGDFNPTDNDYHSLVMDAASDEVVFAGAIYDARDVGALRFHARFHIHGHQVGGTNPSLVEALGAGNAIVAYDNVFNRWVAQDSALYFGDEGELGSILDKMAENEDLIKRLVASARNTYSKRFRWIQILDEYENLLLDQL